jgi:hypothetical protein
MEYDFNNLDHIEQFAMFELLHGHDGPVDRFIAISRAMRICAQREYTPSDIANGLHTALRILEQEGGYLHSTEFACFGF